MTQEIVTKTSRADHAALISAALVKGVEAAIEAGHRLAVAQGELTRPEFLAMLGEDLGISEGTASKLMSVASHPVLSELSKWKVLPPDWTTLCYSQVQVQTDHRLIKCIAEQIGDNKIDVSNFDPLVTLHAVTENDPGKMDGVIRIFSKIADTQNCAIDLSHHTRKLAPGSGADDYGIDDMRGAGSVKDAMRAVRMLNYMSKQDADNAGLLEMERTIHFRVDRAKANYSAPAKTAVWRKFVNVDLPNGDAVGVVTPWLFPGQDGVPSPEKMEHERKAKYVFMETLRRLFQAGRYVGERGPYNAPHVFAKEREAKLAKIGKTALATAMRQLFEEKKIRLEEFALSNRHPSTRIVEA